MVDLIKYAMREGVVSLDEWLSFEQESVQKFKDSYPELWRFFGDSINLARAVPFVIGQQDELAEIEMHRLFL